MIQLTNVNKTFNANTINEKKALVKKLTEGQLTTTERKAFQRAVVKLRNFYLN